MRAYYRTITEAKWITDMAASKMLFLKRPTLAAISDSYIREALGVQDPDTRTHPWKKEFCAERGVAVADTVRTIGLSNREQLATMKETLRAEGFLLSKARAIDVLVWADMAIAAGHPMWQEQARSANWTTFCA